MSKRCYFCVWGSGGASVIIGALMFVAGPAECARLRAAPKIK